MHHRPILRIASLAVASTVLFTACGGIAATSTSALATPPPTEAPATATPSASQGAVASDSATPSKDPDRQGIIDTASLPATVPFKYISNHVVVDVAFGSGEKLPMMLDTGAPLEVSAEIAKAGGWPVVMHLPVLVDTGSDLGIVAAPADLAKVGITPAVGGPRVNARGAGNEGTFDVALDFVTTPIKAGDLEIVYPVGAGDIVAGYGNIGNAFLSQFVVTFDWSTNTMYLDPIAADGSVSPVPVTGAGLTWDGKDILVSSLAEGSSAAKDGLKLGDKVVEADGKKISTRDDFCASNAGTPPTNITTDTGMTFDFGSVEGFYTKP